MKLERYKTNPFLKDMIITSGDKLITIMGKNNNILLNTNTGETSPTQIIAYKKVDRSKFVKLFSENIGILFDLSSAGNKVFAILIHELQNKIDKDIVILDKYTLASWNEQNPTRTFKEAFFSRGKNELVKAQIIAPAERMGAYFINPNFVFNGNRIAFTTMIEANDNI
ncbi:MAG: hypothetical protein KN64_01400 [Sulfurovum sp. AS07-7]|jgi:hypothetical protein|nr:MAG: hypothetical protein KN64_01400 [Sulfurovum sp. AS07-7]